MAHYNIFIEFKGDLLVFCLAHLRARLLIGFNYQAVKVSKLLSQSKRGCNAID